MLKKQLIENKQAQGIENGQTFVIALKQALRQLKAKKYQVEDKVTITKTNKVFDQVKALRDALEAKNPKSPKEETFLRIVKKFFGFISVNGKKPVIEQDDDQDSEDDDQDSDSNSEETGTGGDDDAPTEDGDNSGRVGGSVKATINALKKSGALSEHERGKVQQAMTSKKNDTQFQQEVKKTIEKKIKQLDSVHAQKKERIDELEEQKKDGPLSDDEEAELKQAKKQVKSCKKKKQQLEQQLKRVKRNIRSNNEADDEGLTGGQIALIVIGSVVGLAAIGGQIYYFYLRK